MTVNTGRDRHATPAVQPDEASAVDPGAIDLDELKSRRRHVSFDNRGLPASDIDVLIAAVEALRAREKQTLVMIADMLNGEMKLSRRVEAAEARVVKLAGALGPLIDDDKCRFDHSGFCQTHTNELDDGRCAMAVAIAVLAATSAKALERARAVEEIVKAARFVARVLHPELRSALTKFDALSKEGE